MTFRISLLELLTLVVQVNKVKLLSNGLQGFAELGIKQFPKRFQFAAASGTDRLRDFFHLLLRVVHADEEGDLDVGTNVVLADQAFASLAADLKALERQIHELIAMEQRHNEFAAGRGDVQSAKARFDNRPVWTDHDEVLLERKQRSEDGEQQRCRARSSVRTSN